MRYKKILVPVDGGSADQQAVELACRLAKTSHGKVHIIYVVQVRRTFPLEAELRPEIERGEEVLDRAERAAEEEYEAETELLQAREAGPAIVEEAVERGVDLIVIGLSYRSRFGQFNLGDTAPYVLKNAPCHVLLSREPVAVQERAQGLPSEGGS